MESEGPKKKLACCVNCLSVIEDPKFRRKLCISDGPSKTLSEVYGCNLQNVIRWIDNLEMDGSYALYLCRKCHRNSECLEKARLKVVALEAQVYHGDKEKNIFLQYLTDVIE